MIPDQRSWTLLENREVKNWDECWYNNRRVDTRKRLRTRHHPGQRIELWLDEQKISKLADIPPRDRPFILDFIANLEELGWTVLIEK